MVMKAFVVGVRLLIILKYIELVFVSNVHLYVMSNNFMLINQFSLLLNDSEIIEINI